MEPSIRAFEKYVSYALLIIGMLFTLFQMADLIYEFFVTLSESVQTQSFLRPREGRPVVALFFSILLTLEVLETVRLFSKDHMVKIRIILLVGLIAVTRKILMMDMSHAEPVEEFAVAGLVVALSVGYFLVSRSVNIPIEKNANNSSDH